MEGGGAAQLRALVGGRCPPYDPPLLSKGAAAPCLIESIWGDGAEFREAMAKPTEIWELYECDCMSYEYIRPLAAFATKEAAVAAAQGYGTCCETRRLVLWPGAGEWEAAGRPDAEDDIDLEQLAPAETADG